jgi:ribosomal protein S3
MKLIKKNSLLWKTKYYEKTKRENAFYLYNSLEIDAFIKRFFKIYKIILNDYKLNYFDSKLEIFISYYTTIQSLKILQKSFIKKSVLLKSFKNYKTKILQKILKYKSNSKKRLKLIVKLKRHFLKNKLNNNFSLSSNNFSELFLESLSLFTKKRFKIILVLQNLNKGLSFRLNHNKSIVFKKVLLKFRKFTSFFFFKETINILMLIIYKAVNIKLLTEFIAFQFSVMKKHNTFLVFLKQAVFTLQNSNFSSIKGLKLLIKGRLNGAPRARNKILSSGSVPLQNFTSEILKSTSISYTPNGTFSITAWACKN